MVRPPTFDAPCLLTVGSGNFGDLFWDNNCTKPKKWNRDDGWSTSRTADIDTVTPNADQDELGTSNRSDAAANVESVDQDEAGGSDGTDAATVADGTDQEKAGTSKNAQATNLAWIKEQDKADKESVQEDTSNGKVTEP